MPALQWSDALALNQPQMDTTHREFVDLLQHLQSTLDADAAPAQWLARYDELVEHTVHHFAQEQRWMDDMGFDAENCHARQHASVLQTLEQVRATLQQSHDAALLGRLVDELGQWFTMHAQSMDAALRDMVHTTGYDPRTRHCERPLTADAPGRHSCGSTSCA